MNKTIAYITDIHLNEQQPIDHGSNPPENWNRILADIEKYNIDELVFGGDIGDPSAYKDFFQSLDKYPRLQITLGNHDSYDDAIKHYPNPSTENTDSLYYSYSDDHFKYIFLDSSSGVIGERQLNWLENELTSAQSIVLFIHHPILRVDTPVDAKYPLENREQIKAMLIAHTKDVTIFCGHYHTEDESEFNNIRQFVTPAASYQIKKGTVDTVADVSYFGYRMIYINENSISTEVMTLFA